MSVDSGKIMFTGGGQFLLDRVQSGDVSRNTPEEVIKELGNEESVETVRDIPESTFSLESFDTSVELEALLCRENPSTINTPLNLRNALPIDITAPHKGEGESKNATHGVILAGLSVNSVRYAMGVDQNAGNTFQLVNDYEWPGVGSPIAEEFAGQGDGDASYTLGTPNAVPTEVRGQDRYVLSACVYKADGSYTQLAFDEYTDNATTITLLDGDAAPVGSVLAVTYFTTDIQEYLQGVHPTATVKPGAIKGKDIRVYVGPQGGPLVWWRGLQSTEFNWSRTGTAEKEMGSVKRVATDYDTPEVTGNLTMRPGTLEYLYARIVEVTGGDPAKVANVLNTELLEILAVYLHPTTGAVLKGLRTPAARVDAPPLSARVNEKRGAVFNFKDDGGNLEILSPAALAAEGISG